MSMEFKLNSMGGGDFRPLFRGGRVELLGSFGTCRDVRSFGEVELCEEIEPERRLDSTSVAAGHLVEGALAWAR